MNIANEYFSCKSTRLLQELYLVVELGLSSKVESKHKFNSRKRAILTRIFRRGHGSWTVHPQNTYVRMVRAVLTSVFKHGEIEVILYRTKFTFLKTNSLLLPVLPSFTKHWRP